MVAELCGVGGAVHVAHDGIARFAVHRGLVERGGLVDAFKVEADDLLRLAIFLDLEVVGGEAAHHFPGLLVADHDVGEDEVAVHLEGKSGLGIRCWGLILRSHRHHSQQAHEGEGGESAKVADDVHPN